MMHSFTLDRIEPWHATVEQVRDAILTGQIATTTIEGRGPDPEHLRFQMDEIMTAAVEAVRMGRMVDVGFVPNAIVQAEAKRVKTLVHGGWLRHPFREPWVLYHQWEQGPAPLLVLPWEDGSVSFAELQPSIMQGHLRLIMIGDTGTLIPAENDGEPGFNAIMSVAPVRQVTAPRGMSPEQLIRDAACNVGDPCWTALAMLQTDGVRVEHIPAPDRLNQQRARKGKHPIPARVKVHSGPYVTALTARGKAGSHAAGDGSRKAPVMHLRRGHVRRFDDGRQTWVRDALINAREDAAPTRSHYEVRGPRRV
jgi:hypothetical protein